MLSDDGHTEAKAQNQILWGWIVVGYLMPLLIMATMLNEAGWYGTGLSGQLQGIARVVAFFVGAGCSYYDGLLRGTKAQKRVAGPAALAYTGLVLAMVYDQNL